jgi:hypothetical protein
MAVRCYLSTSPKPFGPEKATRHCRFAIGVIKSDGVRSVAQKMRQLTRALRLIFHYLRMIENLHSCTRCKKNKSIVAKAHPSLDCPESL